MKKILWSIAAIPLALLILAVSLSGYYIHILSFNERILCATGEPDFLFLPPACRAYIGYFYTGDTPEEIEEMSASLGFLVSGYRSNEKNAVGDRSLALADRFIRQGADVNYANERGETPLHEAVIFGSPVLIEFLLDRGADPKKRTFITFIGETLSPLELAKKINEEGKKYGNVDWKGIIATLTRAPQSGSGNNG